MPNDVDDFFESRLKKHIQYVAAVSGVPANLINDNTAQQNMHWTAGIVRRFKHFPVVKFFLSLWHSLASRQ